MTIRAAVLLLSLIACDSNSDTKARDTDHGTDTGSLDVEDDTGTGGDTGSDGDPHPPPEGPCGDGGWGSISSPESSFHISLEVIDLLDDWGKEPGSPGNPLSTAAELESRVLEADHSAEAIAFWPGTHSLDPGLLSRVVQTGLRIEGCGAEEVQVAFTLAPDHEGPLIQLGAGAGEELWPASAALTGLTLETDQPHTLVSIVAGAEVSLTDLHLNSSSSGSLIVVEESVNVNISHTVLTGGQHALKASDSQISIDNSVIQDGTIAGIWTTGGSSGIILDEVVVENISPAAGITDSFGGWGMVFEGGDVHASNVTLSGATGAGIMADVDTFSLTNATISHVTSSSAGQFGRGIYLFDSDCSTASVAVLNHVVVEMTEDAGVFVQRVLQTDITDLTVQSVGLSEVPEDMGGGMAGDALVITGRDEDTAAVYSSTPEMQVQILNSISITDPSRAAIIVDNAQVRLELTEEAESALSDISSEWVFTQNGGSLATALPITALGDGDDADSWSSSGPYCLNLSSPSMDLTTPSVEILSCTAFAD